MTVDFIQFGSAPNQINRELHRHCEARAKQSTLITIETTNNLTTMILSGNTDRSVLHLDLDTFFVSVERLKNSRLNGKPVIIGGMSDRGVVSSCSYEARKYGVSSAMPMKMARNMCPDAIVIRGDMELYSNYSNIVTGIIAERAPLYEKASVDEHYIDLTGMDRFYGCYKWSHELRQYIIKETGLPISIGLSVNKTVSKIATGEAKPNGEIEVQKRYCTPIPRSAVDKKNTDDRSEDLPYTPFNGHCNNIYPEEYTC